MLALAIQISACAQVVLVSLGLLAVQEEYCGQGAEDGKKGLKAKIELQFSDG